MPRKGEGFNTERKVFRGYFGEVIRTIQYVEERCWMMAWRCRRCSHVWPVRAVKRDGKKAVLDARPEVQVEDWRELYRELVKLAKSRRPKRCPGCQDIRWWKARRPGVKTQRFPRHLAAWRRLEGLKPQDSRNKLKTKDERA